MTVETLNKLDVTSRCFPEISAGNRTIALTILIAGVAAILFPIREGDDD